MPASAEPYAESGPEFDEFVEETLFEEAPPEAPKPTRAPPLLMLVVDEEEEVEFCAPPPASPPLQVIKGSEDETAALSDEPEAEPPFDPPDLEDLMALEDDEIEDDDEPPFDPANLEDLTPPSLSAPIAAEAPLVLAPANENSRASLGPVRNAQPEGARDLPAPAIRLYLSWDRREAAEFFNAVGADPRLSRTEITIARGGLDGAAVHCAFHQKPDLVVVDTTLRGAALIASLDRLMEAAGSQTKVIVLGAVNDVSLLREMAQRGVDEYLIWPIKPEDVAGSACALFADVDKARVIAVVGARGGIGASTIAHNLAWCIAERQRARTTLVDLDMPFGTAAFDFKIEPIRSLADIIEGEGLDDIALERVGVKRTDRLTILSAPATPRRGGDVEAEAARALISAARRLSSYVVLDLPHLWTPWVKQALLGADEIVLVTSPDIASLRNTDNIAKALRNERPAEPIVVLSMTGVPKRPEVPFKEFAEALTITPAVSLAFEPNIFGAASITGQMLPEIAPGSKAAGLLEQLATLLTGRACIDAPPAEPRVLGDELPEEDFDPFEDALVNRFALEWVEEDEAPPTGEQTALAPLELLELAPIEPDYMAKARAAAFDALDVLETSRHHPERRFAFGPLAGFAAGFAMAALAVGALLFMRTQPAPASAAAHVVAEVKAAPPPVPAPAPITPEQMAAQYQAAARLIEQNAPRDALAPMQRLADAGFVMAQYRLAKMYERGEGVAADLVQARIWTERAAGGGNRNALHDLGVYFARGEGAPRDAAAASRWFRQAAELGLADSQFNLGVLYAEGRGVEADVWEALYWFRLAARQGDVAAGERAIELELGLTPYDLEQVDARVAAFQPRAADPVANGEFPQAVLVTAPASHAVGSLPTSLAADETPR